MVGYSAASLLPYAGGLCALTAGLVLWKKERDIKDVLREAFKYSGLYTDSKKDGVRLPTLKRRKGIENGVSLSYSLPVGLCASDFLKQWERLEEAVKGEISFINEKEGLRMDVLYGELPGSRGFHFPDMGHEIGIPVGYSRAGFITEDLAEMPHLLVAGQTNGGKSVFLHGAVACLLKNPRVNLFLIDLARAEFSYTKDHADFAYTVDGAYKTLSFLQMELDRRLNVLDRYKIEKIQNYPHSDLPYLVLIIDEISALSPALVKEKGEKRKREECHFLMSDLLARARKVGIHLIVSTQRPDKDVLPGIMKANIPATVCFKVRNRVNSEICLDHGRAASLPDIKGRAIWQFREEREVQVMHLSPQQARSFLPSAPPQSETPLISQGEF